MITDTGVKYAALQLLIVIMLYKNIFIFLFRTIVREDKDFNTVY